MPVARKWPTTWAAGWTGRRSAPSPPRRNPPRQGPASRRRPPPGPVPPVRPPRPAPLHPPPGPRGPAWPGPVEPATRGTPAQLPGWVWAAGGVLVLAVVGVGVFLATREAAEDDGQEQAARNEQVPQPPPTPAARNGRTPEKQPPDQDTPIGQ